MTEFYKPAQGDSAAAVAEGYDRNFQQLEASKVEADEALRQDMAAADAETLVTARTYTDERETVIRTDLVAADTTLQAAIETETERASEEEAVIRTDFTAADTILRAAIEAETDRASAEEAAIRGGADEEYNNLRKLQTAIETINRAISGTETPDVIDTLNEALAFIREHQSEIESLVATYLKKAAIADDLTTDDAAQVLSARQGVELARRIGERATSSDLTAHVADENKHITDEERADWNAKLNAEDYTAEDVLAKLQTVDGKDSGLCADSIAEQRTGAAFKIWHGTETEYNAIPAKEATTLYMIRND